MSLFFGLFLLSGFCSLVYQVVWLRLSMAQFGVTTPQVSMVLSVFMAGLGIGSWLAGRVALRFSAANGSVPLRLYAACELLIALSASVVPAALRAGGSLMSHGGGGLAWGSGAYLAASGACVSAALLPFTTAMGATFPLGMWAIARRVPSQSGRSFSYLYVANVVGATAGTLASAFVLIELLGFQGTLALAAGLNALIAAAALVASLAPGDAPAGGESRGSAGDAGPALATERLPMLSMLFVTGLTSMAMEVVWVRQFTPYLGNMVYTFAAILGLYLVATFSGSRLYRARLAGAAFEPGRSGAAWLAAGVLTLLPLLTADPRLPLPGGLLASVLRTALGIGPICLVFGVLTPALVDRLSGGDASRAGSAYALNVLGCILGPLLAGFVLLPLAGEKWSLLALALPLFALGLRPLAAQEPAASPRAWRARLAVGGVAVGLLAATDTFETRFADREVRRDYMATVVATGKGMRQQILVNGIGMTYLTPITKMMVHLPLAHLGHPPRKALVICFGMGTSFRSARSWAVETTAVELVPSIPALFPRFHKDAQEIVAAPGARIVVDDGRRFLERSSERFDVIVIDPPPPVETAGSSLLYSREFYAALRRRLEPGGIVQQWIPGGEPVVVSSLVQALAASFPHTRFFQSFEGWGTHALASDAPIPALAAPELGARLPRAAARDLVEWGPLPNVEAFFDAVLRREVPFATIVGGAPRVGPLRDDRPINEYFLLRRYLGLRS